MTRPRWHLLALFMLVWGWRTDDALAVYCRVELTNTRLASARSAAVDALVRTDNARVEAIVREATDLLECSTEVLDADSLAALYLYLGMARLRDGELDRAHESFRKALAIAPALGWDRNFEPELEAEFLRVRDEIRTESPVQVTLRGDVQTTFYLDGRPVDAEVPVPVARGIHLLQMTRGVRVTGAILISTVDGAPVTREVGDIPPLKTPRKVAPRLRRTAILGAMGGAALAVVGSSIALFSARSSYEAWQEGRYEAGIVLQNHRAVLLAWVGAGLGITFGGTGTAVSLFTVPRAPESVREETVTGRAP